MTLAPETTAATAAGLMLRIGYDMTFEVPSATPMLLMLYVHPDRSGDLVVPEVIHTEPDIPITDFTDSLGNRAARIVAPAGLLRVWSDSHIHDSGAPDPVKLEAQQLPVHELPADVLPYLLGSRYCEVDRLSAIAWDLFGKTKPGWSRVQAVCDWVQGHVEFGYKHARANKTALDVYIERRGVCRDYMHLAISFCRALGIPSRYATGYLSDIDAPPDPTPMDFSAFFEVFLEDRWWVFDARYNTARVGRILMGRGRDAVDVALTTSFGPTKLVKFKVITECAS